MPVNLTPVTMPAGEEAWRLLQELLMQGEMPGRMREACEAIGAPPSAVKALLHLSPDTPVAMRDIAEHWGCDASYVTELVDGLEALGIATRQPHPTDRRVRTVLLTEHGAQVRERVQQVMWRVPEAFSVLTGAEQRQLRDLARKLAGANLLFSARAKPLQRAGTN